MENSTPKLKTAVVSAAVCMLCVGLVFFGTGCPMPPTTPCTTDADCDDGLFCNGEETCVNSVCQPGTNPCEEDQICDEENDVCVTEGCQTDDDCADDEFCDTETGECVPNENLYETAEFDHDLHSGSFTCTECHHDGAGFSTCDTCHNRDEVVAGIIILKDAMHNPDTGCRSCHDAEFSDNCAFCHTALSDF